jgi:hypothetical protein
VCLVEAAQLEYSADMRILADGLSTYPPNADLE